MNVSQITPARFPLFEVAPLEGDKSHREAQKIMAIFLKSGGDRNFIRSYLKGEKLEYYADQFAEDLRNDLVDLAYFFHPNKIEEGRELFKRFAVQYENEAARRRREEESDQREIEKLEAEIAVYEMERKQLNIQMARADEEIARADEKIARADAMLIEERERRPLRLAQSLYAIFTKTNLPDEQAEEIISRYLNNGDLTVEENEKGVPFLKISSMNTVIQFFFDHPNIGIKSLDFRHFGHIESVRVQEIADFLQDPATECIRGIAFKEINMPDLEASKTILGNLAAFRQQCFGKFTVQCK